MIKREFYQDRYSSKKVWEVVQMAGYVYYLRQYIDGRLISRGTRTTKNWIRSLGILDFEKIDFTPAM